MIVNSTPEKEQNDPPIAHFLALFQHASQGIIIINSRGEIVLVNPFAEKIFGYNNYELKGKKMDVLVPEEYRKNHDVNRREYFKNPINRPMGKGKDLTAIGKDGKTIPLEISLGYYESDGEMFAVAFFTDISLRKKQDELLKLKKLELELLSDELKKSNVGLRKNLVEQAEEIVQNSIYYQALIENNPDIIALVDADGKMLYQSPAALRITGYSAEELSERNVFEFTHPDFRKRAQEFIEKTIQQPAISHVINIKIIDKKGDDLWLKIIGNNQLKNEVIRAIICNCSDITSLMKAEDNLIKAHLELDKLFSSVNENLFSVSMPDHRLIQMSPACEKIYGYPPSVFFEQPMMWYEMIIPEDKHIVDANYPKVHKGEPVLHQYRIRHSDGSIRWLESNLSPTLDGRGQLIRIDGMTRDISEIKRAEEDLKKLNEELEERVRQRTADIELANKDLEAFSYSVSHDLRTPLRSINGYAKLLMKNKKITFSEEDKEYLEGIVKQTNYMASLIENMLRLSKLGEMAINRQKGSMKELVEEVALELKAMGDAEKIDIKLKVIEPAHHDPALMRQVWVNLISNAIKYSAKKDKTLIEIGSAVKDSGVTYYIRDNGVGFSMEYADKLFEVFQRLHPSSDFEGTGIGLSIAHRIIRKHGGKLWAEGKEGEGATFYFELPVN